jgi:O-antigen ligase
LYEAEGGQGQVRVLLWENGVEALLSAPLLGLGPGGHSGIAAPFSGAEAHNTFVDWGTNTGLVGLLAYVALLTWIAIDVWRSRHPTLIAALVATQVLSMFHFTLRHPVYWFYLTAIHAIALGYRAMRAEKPTPATGLVEGAVVTTPMPAAVGGWQRG